MPSYKTTGIILRRTNYGEADRIFTVLTSSHGKVEAIAKSVRKMNSKLGSHLEPLTVIDLMLAKGRNLDIITYAKVRESFTQISSELQRTGKAFLFAEMIHKLTQHDTSKQTFELLRQALSDLDKGIEPALVELYFKLHLLRLLGHKPNLDVKEASGRHYYFNVETGAVATAASGRGYSNMAADHIKLWRLMLDYPLSAVAKVRGVAQAAADTLPIANDFYDYLYGIRFKSAEI
ncbi:DNA repair protein RecO [Candidatus Microgenomates bacterium]|nr:DNA repair protein RecO [Candidatus Microgenomates bacterium]